MVRGRRPGKIDGKGVPEGGVDWSERVSEKRV